jgi:hypothetical protein
LEKCNKSIISSNVDAILNPEVEFDPEMNSSEGRNSIYFIFYPFHYLFFQLVINKFLYVNISTQLFVMVGADSVINQSIFFLILFTIWFFQIVINKLLCTNIYIYGWWRWLSGIVLASLVLDGTGFWVRISARTPILRNITTGGDITGGFFPGAGFPSCHKSIYRVSEDNFRGSACVSEWMLVSVKRLGVGLS